MKKFILVFLVIFILGGAGIVILYYNDTDNLKENHIKKVVKSKKNKFSGIFKDSMGRAQKIRKSMSLEEKVGQMFIVRYDDSGVYTITRDLHPGGYILFAKDFKEEDSQSIKEKLKNINGYSKIPLAYAVDEEGGIVNRVSKYPQFRESPFPSSQELYNEGGISKVLEVESEKAELLLNLGINLNLEPVSDVSFSPDDFIYERSLGRDALTTADYVSSVVKLMNEKKISGCLKHFPGYGNNVDTHTGVAIDEREYGSFEENDFKPFVSGIDAGVPMILVSHNVVNSMDPNSPASLSEEVHNVLREKLGFSGVIITDDLDMGAIKEYTKDNSPIVMAVNALNDLMITSSFERDSKILVEEAKKDKNISKKIDKAVDRILAWKIAYGILK